MEEGNILTFVTYNLDSREYNFEERLDAFLELVKKSPPDAVVIQEGNRLSYEKLLREMGLLGYKRNLLDIMNHRKCGEIIFSKHRIVENEYLPFQNSVENRGVTLSKIDAWDVTFYVCTTQLDRATPAIRSQINLLDKMVRSKVGESCVIFGGDVRLANYQTDITEPDGWYDGWIEAGSSTNELTVDCNTNMLVEPPISDRPDRVWFLPGKDRDMECMDYQLYGNKSDVTISSHYGIWTQFKFT